VTISGSRNPTHSTARPIVPDPILVLLAGIAPPYCARRPPRNNTADSCPRIWCVRPVNNPLLTSTTPWQLVGMRSPVASTRASDCTQSARANHPRPAWLPTRAYTFPALRIFNKDSAQFPSVSSYFRRIAWVRARDSGAQDRSFLHECSWAVACLLTMLVSHCHHQQ
jgi:hypothetical protein